MGIRVTFDSNAWESIVDGNASCLRDLIESKKISPYFCEIALALESIQKVEREKFFKEYKPKIETEISSKISCDDTVSGRMTIQPNMKAHPGMHPTLEKKFHEAIAIGFKILPMTRLGTVRCNEVNPDMRIDFHSTEEFWDYAEKLSICTDYIEELGCGAAEYFAIKDGKIHSKDSMQKTVQYIARRYPRAIAEWGDGDSIAAHYASGNQFFCTQDLGISSGKKSIFHPENIRRLKERFNVHCLTMHDLQDFFSEMKPT